MSGQGIGMQDVKDALEAKDRSSRACVSTPGAYLKHVRYNKIRLKTDCHAIFSKTLQVLITHQLMASLIVTHLRLR